jgi:hypothetical protein
MATIPTMPASVRGNSRNRFTGSAAFFQSPKSCGWSSTQASGSTGIRRVFEQVALHSQRVIERYVTAGLISEIPPTCGAPISHALTSQAPTYRAPTSETPTSKVPTSRAPISLASSSQMPTCRALAELSEIEVEQDGRRDQSAAGVARTPTRRSSGLTRRNCGA